MNGQVLRSRRNLSTNIHVANNAVQGRQRAYMFMDGEERIKALLTLSQNTFNKRDRNFALLLNRSLIEDI